MYLPTELVDADTGERIAFDEDASDDDRLVWSQWTPADLEPPPAHLHPATEERFAVREGALVVEVAGEERRLGAGDDLVVSAGSPHRSFTREEPAHYRREVTPPGRWREFLTRMFAASHVVDDESSAGELLQMALLLRAYPDVVVAASPPRPVQRVLLPALAAVARATGRRADHPYPRPDESLTDGPAPEPNA